jgi:hypothetical protein
MTDATQAPERVIDDTYTAVFPLSRQQLATHCADIDNEAASDKYGMDNIRVTRQDDGSITTESTKGTIVVKVTEKAGALKDAPFAVNPSETPDVILVGPAYISGKMANRLLKGMPQRKNTSAEAWQREAVLSYNEDGKIEAGYADKQGNAVLETLDPVSDDAKQFPPIEGAWPPIAPTLRVGFKVDKLREMVDVLENAEIETVALEFFERTTDNIHYDAGRAMKFYSVEPRPGKTLPRDVQGLLMPFNIE